MFRECFNKIPKRLKRYKMQAIKNMFVLCIGLLSAQLALGSDFIEAKELAKIMNDENVVVISAQKSGSYNDFHITGSISLPPSILVNNDPTTYMLKSVSEMEKIIGSKGVSQTNQIIIYDEGSHKYSGRLYWNLKYLGVTDVKILNGGLESWKAIRKPVTSAATNRKETIFTANVQDQYLASLGEVKKAISDPSYVIIDARSDAEYKGTNETSLQKGHIPNAVHINYSEVIASNGVMKSNEQLTELYTAKGVTPDKTVIIYCKTSVRAAIQFAALNSSLGYENVKVFDGAFVEWSSDMSTEVVQ
jgi:thiosulfate/3-mercaptopyruvate sulfurtransferase